jgi:hypothetical protein
LFSPDTPVSSTNKADCHDIADILFPGMGFSTVDIFLMILPYFTIWWGQLKKKGTPF